MNIRKIYFGGLVFLTGCSPTMWNPPGGGSIQQGKADIAFCNAQARTAQGGTEGFSGLAIFKQNQEMCMEGKGYTKSSD